MLKIAYNKSYNHPLENNHRFPMKKYDLIPKKLIDENVCKKHNFFEPADLKDDNILLTHGKTYFENLSNLKLEKKESRSIGFPLNQNLIYREKKIAQGTIECSVFSLKLGVSLNIAGGTHHAFKNKPGAFCMLNDQAIAANYLLKNKLVKRIMIVDLDVHQGDGTASIFRNDNRVYTLSFHGKKNYPFKKEISDFDYEFDDGTKDEFYLKELKNTLPKLVKKLRPEFIFYLAGVDVLESDKLGRLSLTIEGCKERDSFVLNYCKKNIIPVQISMGGGYSPKIDDIVEAHCNTFKLAKEIFYPN
ncbi:MAG: histone deacetylase [Flavobacteriaceae bacterium]